MSRGAFIVTLGSRLIVTICTIPIPPSAASHYHYFNYYSMIDYLECLVSSNGYLVFAEYIPDYNTCLVMLNLLAMIVNLLLLSEFEINDIIFFTRYFKSPASHFDITNYVYFGDTATRSDTHIKLKQSY